ncbi:hypothetical protein KP509_16G045700 [Ceratopteris richardii]|uniref:Uncharacterized protein n=1 Tax=Ceratopteris richardii TaxID=49495 RepID=A0A8T2SZ84_CERRI|nr:hypothetical protein KP509_16G045700 [Ceratopteris richardii]KAH7387860.1 hypothetical protein KP509_16G045700 [Ceratopteris richardii]
MRICLQKRALFQFFLFPCRTFFEDRHAQSSFYEQPSLKDHCLRNYNFRNRFGIVKRELTLCCGSRLPMKELCCR